MFVGRRGTELDVPTLLDFGVADGVREQVAKVVGKALNTKVLSTLPPGYAAPERHHGTRTPRGDLYSLGVILHEMLTGRRMFERPTALALITAHAIDAPPRLPPRSDVDDDQWRKLDALLQRLLAKKEQDRPASAAEVEAALAAI